MRITDLDSTGRAFAIVTHDLAPRGYVDIDFDDYASGTLLDKLQNTAGGGGDHRSKVSRVLSGSLRKETRKTDGVVFQLAPDQQKTKTQWSESATN